MPRLTQALVVGLLWLTTFSANAHSFGRLYNLPVPLWMYIYGAAAALVLSFLIAGFFLTAHDRPLPSGDWSTSRGLGLLQKLRVKQALQLLSVMMLALCIATGFLGNPDPYRNLNMTFFWVVFVLAFAYVTALLGNGYAVLNPWQLIISRLATMTGQFRQGRWRYPAALGYWPALTAYMAFIAIELFVFNRPSTLAWMLTGYTAITLLGAWAFGIRAWFRYGEFFSVFLRLFALAAPLEYRPATVIHPMRLRWRLPFAGLLEQRAEHGSLVVFVLFMLSSTAFDGLHATAAWFRLFWIDTTGLLTPLFGQTPVLIYAQLYPLYQCLQVLCLLISPFLYWLAYVVCLALAKVITGSPIRLRALTLRFAFSLLPIALVYHITHYYTLILTQGVKIFSLLSDPFGWGWNLFGTAGLFRAPILPDMGTVWHTQVGLILLGHIVSVWLAHVEALRVFPTRRMALLSQVPLLFLMVLFTAVGLWILAQPIQAGR